MTFDEFCFDIVGSAPITAAEESQMRVDWMRYTQAAKKVARVKHADEHLTASAVRAKLERLVASQRYDVNRYPHLQLDFAREFLAKADAALAARTKKADLLDLITLNSEVSRNINAQLVAAK